ncbi:MAG TPA: C39 family peptidase [Nitrososphaeraceae archaeon]
MPADIYLLDMYCQIMHSQGEDQMIHLPLVSKESEHICLPLVVNVISKYWGEDINPDEADQAAGKYSDVRGTIMIEGIELAERHRLVSYIYKGSLKDIKKRIDQGIPPIVIMPGIQETVQHASIVCGYSNDERRIFTYVPEPDTIGAIPESMFKNDWEQEDFITIVIVPKDIGELLDKENLMFRDSNRVCFKVEKMKRQVPVDEVIKNLKLALNKEPDNAQGWYILGSLYNDRNMAECIDYYEKAISLNPKCFLAHRGLGNYYLKNKEFHKAEDQYSKAISINARRYGSIYKNRAVARTEIGKNLEAKQDLIEYLAQIPNAHDRASIEEAIRQS